MSKCPDCMNEWDERMCASCGYQPGAPMITPNALPPGMTLANRYALGNALGVSRQSIAYAAWDQQTNQRVIITEFYPAVIVKRIHGAVIPQRNQAQFQVAMNRYHAFDGQQALPLVQAFFGNNTAYRVYAAAEQPQLKKQSDMLLDQPILFRNEMGQAQLTINALMIDPLPKERPYTRVGNPGAKKKKKLLVAILTMLLALVACSVIVLPQLSNQPIQSDPTSATSDQPVNTTAAPELVAQEVTQAPTQVSATAEPDVQEVALSTTLATVQPTVQETVPPTAAPVTSAPAATAVPTLAPSIDSWYLKANGQLWQVDKDNQASNPAGDASSLQLDTVTISGLDEYKLIHQLNHIVLRSEEARTEFDLSGYDGDIALDLQPGGYTLILGREAQLSETLSLSRKVEIPFSSAEGNITYATEDFNALCDSWYVLFGEATEWADANAENRERLALNSLGFYAVDGAYYSIGENGQLTQLTDADKESFYLFGTDDPLEKLKIPLYPVTVPAQQLDQNVFVNAVISNPALPGSELDISSLLLNADGNEIFYASQGSYEIAIKTNPAFKTADGQPYTIPTGLVVGEGGELPTLDEAQMKAMVFQNCGLWAYQLGEKAPVICGADLEPAALSAMFGTLVENNAAFALHDVSFVSADINGNQLAFTAARVNRNGVQIPLAELLQSPVEAAAEPQSPEIPAETAAPELTGAVATEAPVVVQSAVAAQPDMVETAAIHGLKLSSGAYTFYPAEGESIAVDINVNGNTEVTLDAVQLQAMQKALLEKIAIQGVGYIAHVEKDQDGLFIYQLDGKQMKLTSEAVSAIDAAVVSAQQKYSVSIDCAPQKLEKDERESLGIVYVGDEVISNPAELTFAANDDLAKLEKVALKDLAQWDGDKLTLALGPGSYRLYYTSTDSNTNVQTTRFSDVFISGEDISLDFADHCEHNWQEKQVKAATCRSDGAKRQECTICFEQGLELIPIPALDHEMKAPTCTDPETCTRCGSRNESRKALGHDWREATCTTPKTCNRCNDTEGSAQGHSWQDATCTAPKTCTACSATEGSAQGHSWKDATCTAPKTCTACSATDGSAQGHSWKDATCTAPKTCTACSATEGSAQGHSWQDATCTAPKTCTTCNTTEGSAQGHSWQDATCTTSKTCTTCNTTDGNAKGHSYSNGSCTRCEAPDPNASKDNEEHDRNENDHGEDDHRFPFGGR